MSLTVLAEGIGEVLSSDLEIERVAADVLARADFSDIEIPNPAALNELVKQELHYPGLPSVCQHIANTPLPWSHPSTSKDPAYIALNKFKVHVELLGPDGLLLSNEIRLGVYGLLPDAEYGIRTHPAEEIFIMLAGEAFWKKGNDDYQLLKSGGRSFHPSMMPHATKTGERAFMSLYIWRGDVSIDNYHYHGS